MDSLRFVRDLGRDAPRPTGADLAAARGLLAAEAEHEPPRSVPAPAARTAPVSRGGGVMPARRVGAIALAVAAAGAIVAAAFGGATLLSGLADEDRVTGPTPSESVESTEPPVTGESDWDVDDPTTWTLTPDGAGPLRLGASLTETASLLAEQGMGTPVEWGECTISSLSLDGDWGLGAIDDRIVAIAYKDDSGVLASSELARLEDGTSIDSTYDELRARHGEPEESAGYHFTPAWPQTEGAPHLVLTHGIDSSSGAVFMHSSPAWDDVRCFD